MMGHIVTHAGAVKVSALTLAFSTRVKLAGLRVPRTTGTTWMSEESTMTETPGKTGRAWAEFSIGAFEPVGIVRAPAIESLCSAT